MRQWQTSTFITCRRTAHLLLLRHVCVCVYMCVFVSLLAACKNTSVILLEHSLLALDDRVLSYIRRHFVGQSVDFFSYIRVFFFFILYSSYMQHKYIHILGQLGCTFPWLQYRRYFIYCFLVTIHATKHWLRLDQISLVSVYQLFFCIFLYSVHALKIHPLLLEQSLLQLHYRFLFVT